MKWYPRSLYTAILLLAGVGALQAGWERLPCPDTLGGGIVVFKTTEHGWMLTGQAIWRTRDGGLTWEQQFRPGGLVAMRDIDFSDTLFGMAVGDTHPGGAVLGWLITTTDGGATWRRGSVDWHLEEIYYCRRLSPGIAWYAAWCDQQANYFGYVKPLCPGTGPEANMFCTFFRGLDAVDSLYAWATSDWDGWRVSVWRSNPGDSWLLLCDSFPPGVVVHLLDFTDYGHGWLLGTKGYIFFSSDGGSNWVTQYHDSTEVLNDLAFADSLNGWVVGDSGLILRTHDGGVTWLTEPSPVRDNLVHCCALDSMNAWARGDQGTLIHYGPDVAVSQPVRPALTRPSLLLRCSPNPLSGVTTVNYTLPAVGNSSLRLFDVTGTLVTTLDGGFRSAGSYTISVNQRASAVSLNSGIYLIKLATETATATTKLIVE